MREIKFRVWDPYKGKMSHSPDDIALYLSMNTGQIRRVDGLGYTDATSLLPLQYTGLKDKNGKEIYEGDILKSHTHGRLSEIGFRRVVHSSGEVAYQVDCHLEDEVVGNIYENPELLEE